MNDDDPEETLRRFIVADMRRAQVAELVTLLRDLEAPPRPVPPLALPPEALLLPVYPLNRHERRKQKAEARRRHR